VKLTLTSSREFDFISFEPLTEISSVTCYVEARLGAYSVHDDLPLTRVPEYCAALRAFIEGAADEAILEGAYDFRFILRPFRRGTGLWAEFYLAKFIPQDNSEHGRIALSGGFCVSRESVAVFATQFLKHFESEQKE
jgi:hypothetical protein